MSEQAKHTPGVMESGAPIEETCSSWVGLYIDDQVIAEVLCEDVDELATDANAERLALAWNCHDELLEACRKANTCASLPDSVREIIRDALAKATGGAA